MVVASEATQTLQCLTALSAALMYPSSRNNRVGMGLSLIGQESIMPVFFNPFVDKT